MEKGGEEWREGERDRDVEVEVEEGKGWNSTCKKQKIKESKGITYDVFPWWRNNVEAGKLHNISTGIKNII